MSSLNSSDFENACVVCFKNVDLYSIGVCDHPVCFECSTRMRVLCNQQECPICRQVMPKVLFTKEIEAFSILRPKVEKCNLQDRKYGLFFHSPSIQRRYYRLLDHECFICKRNACSTSFKTFNMLKDHMRRSHELFYCDLCVANLKIFTFERKCYTRVELATHRRKGDADNTSHRGHPLCEFCDTRFMDNDELFRHLRRDHLYCHFCDADGKHQYYSTYDDLRRHYNDEHYLCEEGDCKHERFTSVFRSDIDLKAHYANVHSKNLSKSATRQARTLELEFTLAPRPRPDGGRGRQYGNKFTDRSHEEEGAVGYDSYYLEPGGSGGGFSESRTFNNPLAAANFPSLNGDATNANSNGGPNVTITSKLNPLSQQNFPSLSGTNSAPPRTSAVTITSYTKFGPGAVPARNSANYPALGESSSSASGTIKVNLNNNSQAAKPKSSNVSIVVNHKGGGAVTTILSQNSVRPHSVAEAFPALSSEPIPQAQWVSQKPKRQEPKASKVAPAPVLPANTLNDFPTLSKGGGKKSSSVNIPVSNSWVNLNSFNSDSKTSQKQRPEKNNNNNKTVPKAEDKVGKLLKQNGSSTKTPKSEVSTSKSEDANSQESKTKKKKNKTTSQPVEEPPVQSKSARENGIPKKRSELNIASLEISEPATFEQYIHEFPSIRKPPPGFSVKPPPGFSKFNLSNNSNDLTFTNSSGQSYSIVPSQQFYLPPNFTARNQDLIEKFLAVSKEGAEIQQFKVYSDMFRVGEIPADKYYVHCQNFMGSEFSKIFPELLVLLPNVQKQQELYKVHKGNNAKGKGLEVCGTCQQVVLKHDLRDHLSNHTLENHFSSSSQSVTSNNVWNKNKN
ncbi:hypothetical protein PPYR_13704 [Photinus pyralis]|uniref:RING-type E3 ubiquitin transferase n=3 Tax=Photinus pyralis TaxID=7054 RepID=A0A5N4A9U6_PHOPY|nr:hypothetical protein PPYR_13704 [Photinus pyralis]